MPQKNMTILLNGRHVANGKGSVNRVYVRSTIVQQGDGLHCHR